MKKTLILLLTLTAVCSAQEKKNYKPLLKDLNKMLKSAEEFSWMYEPDFTIVQPYEVDKEGILSVVIKGKAEEQEVIHKYEAQLSDIRDFVMDVYYVISFNSESVIISELKDGKWIEIDRRNFFHLGKPKDEDAHKWSVKLRSDLNELYPLENEYEDMD